MNVRNGLDWLPVCPACWARAIVNGDAWQEGCAPAREHGGCGA